MHINGVGCKEDTVFRHKRCNQVIGRKHILPFYMTGFPDTYGRGRSLKNGILASRHILMEEMHEFLHLPAAFNLCRSKALGGGSINSGNPGTVDGPLIFTYTPVNIDRLSGYIPFSCCFSLNHPPVKSTVTHSVNLPELMKMGFDISADLFIIDIADVAEKGCRLKFSAVFVTHKKRCAGSGGDVTVACSIYYHLGFHAFKPGTREKDSSDNAVSFFYRLNERGMQE